MSVERLKVIAIYPANKARKYRGVYGERGVKKLLKWLNLHAPGCKYLNVYGSDGGFKERVRND